MKKISLIFLSSIILCLEVSANVYDKKAVPENIAKQIPEMQSIKCKFKQEKHLQNIDKAIISGGDFEFKKGEGVYFYTTYPIKSTVNYTNKNYKQINDIVNAISNKKYAKLEKEFDFYYEQHNSTWILGLKPKGSTTKYVQEITVLGCDYINQIDIVQTNGNRTKLWFTKEDL